jgi:plasmid stabilization system protein ParE
MFSLEFNPCVEADIRDTRFWYNSKLQNLGDEYQANIFECFNGILSNPKITPIRFDNIRVKRIHPRFPHYVLYEIFDTTNKILLLGVLHAKRDPKLIKKRNKNIF